MRKTTRQKGKATREARMKGRAQKRRKKEQEQTSRLAKEAVEQAIALLLPASPTTPVKKGPWKRFRKTIGTVIAIMLLYFDPFPSVLPYVSVDKGEPFDPKDPLAIPLTLTNQSFFALKDIEYGCVQLKASIPEDRISFSGNQIYPGNRFIEELAARTPFTISCEFIDAAIETRTPPTVNDLQVTVSFRPWFLPINNYWTRYTRNFRYLVARDKKDGRVRLDPQPPVPLP